MADPPSPAAATSLLRQTLGPSTTVAQTRYVREVLHASHPPPPIPVRFFYTSPLAIDDPLSPLPPPVTGAAAAAQQRQPPRPFSAYDNEALDRAWSELRRRILRRGEERGEKKRGDGGERKRGEVRRDGMGREGHKEGEGDAQGRGEGVHRASGVGLGVSSDDRGEVVSSRPLMADRGIRSSSTPAAGRNTGQDGRRQSIATRKRTERRAREGSMRNEGQELSARPLRPVSGISDSGVDVGDFPAEIILAAADSSSTTGTPFIRAPSRTKIATIHALGSNSQQAGSSPRRGMTSFDDGDEDEDMLVFGSPGRVEEGVFEGNKRTPGFTEKVPVGVSRLHQVVMPELQMEPIYWSPVHDTAAVVRGTWFYKDVMLPVEVGIANMLEAGYVALQPWTETWTDELNSAVEVGALGEVKVLHRLWPEKARRVESRPGTARGGDGLGVQSMTGQAEDPEKEREETVASAGDLIDISTGPNGPDNKAAGSAPYGRDGQVRLYRSSGVIYANATDAYILRPNLQPSAYYGRRPLANYIRKGRSIGIHVVRGFDQEAWDKLHPPKKGPTAAKASQGISTSQAGAPPHRRQKHDADLARSERAKVTDLVLVIHGIGQKLSERIESYHFTHAMNAFRREINVELGTESVKSHLREGMGGIMVLPVNWRLSLSFEEGGYRDGPEDPALNRYTLKDITPQGLTSIRNIVSDVMLDVPYYLSQEYHPRMISACIREANRIYRLWCSNNPGFAESGRVHLIAHSLGSVMAVDILSRQPTYVPPLPIEALSENEPSSSSSSHLLFNTTSLFTCGSPAGFFLLLKKAMLLPRTDRHKPGADLDNLPPGVAGDADTYGCLALDNLYNIVNPYDPIAYHMNAAVDADYAAALRPAFVPSASTSLFTFSNPFARHAALPADPSTVATAVGLKKPPAARLPSNLELETHNFSREEVAERRALLLNDNGQIDYLLRYGGGPLEIQYLTMLSAHSSYWLSRDFTRLVVVEVGRPPGREGTVLAMRAVKKKLQIR